MKKKIIKQNFTLNTSAGCGSTIGLSIRNYKIIIEKTYTFMRIFTLNIFLNLWEET